MLIVVMGVTGAGKSTVGKAIAERLGFAFYDADDFHPPENRAKMARNEPLGDADRWPWLEAMASAVPRWEAAGGAVLACSALKQAYRDVLLKHASASRIVYLRLTADDIGPRLEKRRGAHAFVGEFDRLLAGQFRDLEEPADALVEPGYLSPNELVERVRRRLLSEGHELRGVIHFAEGAPDAALDGEPSAELVDSLLRRLGQLGRVLLIPPDFTRSHSGAGELTRLLYERLSPKTEVTVLPALGTHAPMSAAEIAAMFPGVPPSVFRTHDFRRDLAPLGEVPGSFVSEVSGGKLDYPIECAVNRLIVEGKFDRIISIGQLVPHEVIGIANHNKNVFVGTGGKDIIDRTHFLGAVWGMERIMGRAQTPVRAVLDYMSGQFAKSLPITYLLTVRSRDASGALRTRGLYAGDDEACFHAGVPLVQRVNLELLSAPRRKVVVYLDPAEFKSTWLGNKAIYRTRMAIADQGELVVLAPGVKTFGEDPEIDRLIRRHGYRGTPHTLSRVESDPELAASLSAAAHLIHGSSEGRFRITYAPGGLDRSEVEGVGFEYADPASVARRYDPTRLSPGENRLADGEEIFFISNPALGLWGQRARFSEAPAPA
jgi:carbohydrate kinase (thermoresistant glucokinase family)